MEVEYRVESIEGGRDDSRVVAARVKVTFWPEEDSPIAPVDMTLDVTFPRSFREKSVAELHATAVVAARQMLNEDFILGWLADLEAVAHSELKGIQTG